jgi:hypothetical protein
LRVLRVALPLVLLLALTVPARAAESPSTASSSPILLAIPDDGAPYRLAFYLAEISAGVAFVQSVQAAEIAAFVLMVEQAELAAYQAELARQQAAVRRYTAPSSSGGGGDCYGSDIPDYIVDRESGGSASARNPSGAWGCFQFMGGTWNANCSDLGAHGSAPASAQVECMNRVWAGGAGSSHWAQTR